MNLLALLKRLEFSNNSEYESVCPECKLLPLEHRPGCELKAWIDRLTTEEFCAGAQWTPEQLEAFAKQDFSKADEIRSIEFDKDSDYNFGLGMRATRPLLREWLDEVHRKRLMDGIAIICKEKGLDPETATVRQFMELK